MKDLAIFPKNVWSLAGLKLCLAHTACREGRVAEVDAELASASAKADVKVGASCACALESWGRCCK